MGMEGETLNGKTITVRRERHGYMWASCYVACSAACGDAVAARVTPEAYEPRVCNTAGDLRAVLRPARVLVGPSESGGACSACGAEVPPPPRKYGPWSSPMAA